MEIGGWWQEEELGREGEGSPLWSAPHYLPRCSLEPRGANYREQLLAAGRPKLATFTAFPGLQVSPLFSPQEYLEGPNRNFRGAGTQRGIEELPHSQPPPLSFQVPAWLGVDFGERSAPLWLDQDKN